MKSTDKPCVGELERLGPGGRDIMVMGIDAEGFEQLSTDEKIFAYYLYRAAIAGNRIAFDQAHRHAYEIKHLLEEIFAHSDGLDDATRDAVHEYLKRIWIHHGPYDHYTHTKFTPWLLTQSMLHAAATHASARGARIPLDPAESIEQMLERLGRTIFDPDFEPLQTNQSADEDIVATSAVNYWDRGITSADLDKLPADVRHQLNVRFARRGNDVVPEVYRIGGRYSHELTAASEFISRALPFAGSDEQRRSLELLLEYYRTGDEETFREHCVHWLASSDRVDYVNGFIEVYLDPRGSIGQFEANVSVRANSPLIDGISANALYFEQRMPWPEKYRRTSVTPPVANVVNVLVETGDAGPVSPAAYNLPNYNDIRRDHGSKNVILHNIENTWSRQLLQELADEFFLPEYRDNVMRYSRSVVRPLQVYLHEIVGHGSGQPDESLADDPRVALGRLYSTLEECRADLVALYHMGDDKLVELGAYTRAERDAVVETAYVVAMQGWFSRLDRVPGLEVREAHNRGDHTIMSYILDGGFDGADFGARMETVDGKLFVRVTDPALVHVGLSELLGKIQIIKSTGDLPAAEALFDRFGSHIKPEWKDNVIERKRHITSPKIRAFVFPRLQPVIKDDDVVDVTIHFDEDLTAQQLRFSRLENSTELRADTHVNR